VPVVERETATTRFIDLLTPENSVRALGVFALELTPQIAQLLPPRKRDHGVVVASVAPEAPFSQQGRLAPGDVIHALNGRPMTSVADLKTASSALQAGAAAVLQVERDGELMFIAFRVEPR
jgi:S1-C subfamily serine protease